MTELRQKFQELQDKMEILRVEMKQTGRKLFSEASQNLFDKYPTLESFSWTQYTPYFNDGDVCEFGVNADYPHIKLSTGFDEDVSAWSDLKPDSPEQEKIAMDVRELVGGMDEDIMKQMFGDHVQVVVNRNGTVAVDECEHE